MKNRSLFLLAISLIGVVVVVILAQVFGDQVAARVFLLL